MSVLPRIPSESMGCIVCDPPYGLNFLGHDWDSLPSARVWVEALRVARPGAFLVAFGATRTFHRLMCSIEDSGWEIRDTLIWLYGEGFPKGRNISKAIDARLGADREIVAKSRKGSGSGSAVGVGEPKSMSKEFYHTVPATPEAQAWDGWNTNLKPAWEPIVLARKPFAGPVEVNILRHGAGGLNIDAARIPAQSGDYEHIPNDYPRPSTGVQGWGKAGKRPPDPGGRYPANVVLGEYETQVLRLRYNVPDDARRVIEEYFLGYGPVQNVRRVDRGPSKSSRPDEVLRSDVLCPVDERVQPWGRSSDEGSQASSGVDRPDEAQGQSDGPRKPGLEGGKIPVEGIRDGLALDALGGRADEIRHDGDRERQELYPRASPDHGSSLGSGPEPVGSGPSSQRDQERQSSRKSGDSRRLDPQDDASRDTRRIEVIASRERGTQGGIAEDDIPDAWLKYFEPTGYVTVKSAARMLDEQTGKLGKSTGTQDHSTNKVFSGYAARSGAIGFGDSGGASRFFYCSKVSARERGDYEGFETHPTVKPFRLMRWLVGLVAPPDLPCLDPFCGTGSTGLACSALGVPFVGVDQNPEWIKLAALRIADVDELTREVERDEMPGQLTMF